MADKGALDHQLGKARYVRSSIPDEKKSRPGLGVSMELRYDRWLIMGTRALSRCVGTVRPFLICGFVRVTVHVTMWGGQLLAAIIFIWLDSDEAPGRLHQP